MEKQKGSGLLITIIVTVFVMAIFFVLLQKPQTNDVEIDGVNPDQTILEQSGNLTTQAEDLKNKLEENNKKLEGEL